MKILTIVGARPQFVKAAMVSKAILENEHFFENIEEIILHTGQHYDENMSRIFFEQLEIPEPRYNLQVGSGSHGDTTSRMLFGIEKVIISENPDWVLVYGDTNSTLAGALAAAKLHVPVCHVEAGLRSFNKKMPEEINRVLTDHVSHLLLCPTTTAVNNLKNEGITEGVHLVGDVMYDATLTFGKIAEKQSTILNDLELTKKSYYLATVHRAENTDFPARLKEIFGAFAEIASKDCPLVLPLHPRTKAAMHENNLIPRPFASRFRQTLPEVHKLDINANIYLIPPVSFLDMAMLEKHARVILTDSGGVQKEAYFHETPCVTLRDETEWTETVEAGWNRFVGADSAKIVNSVLHRTSGKKIEEYGNGFSAHAILKCLKYSQEN